MLRNVDKFERGHERGTKLMKGLETIVYEKRWRELDFFSIEKRGLKTVNKYAKVCYKENSD